jgi:hypothetical protein
MYLGAGIGAAGMLYYGFTTSPSSVPQVFHVADSNNGAYHAGVVFGAILFAAIVAGLWLWMAWAVRRRKNWARIVSTVLFGLGGLRLLVGLLTPAGVYTISWDVSWLAGLVAVILLFQRSSNEFFREPISVLPPLGHGYPPHGPPG